ncbi:Hypothetical predicted protein [Pelobates cultripes]|uniref:Uncharacterized protein n=1 Tax=Pelobates cultripes TaxID=61616 RepID=A0AAD1T377_PELCU|nr:Hypothetical predicted protein [Pelobates cultripes]
MDEQLEEMVDKFLERGYQYKDLVRALEEAKSADVTKLDEKAPRLVFPTTFHDASPAISKIVMDNCKMIAYDDTLSKVFKEPPLICYRRNKNLRDLLVHTDLVKSYEKRVEVQSRGVYDVWVVSHVPI